MTHLVVYTVCLVCFQCLEWRIWRLYLDLAADHDLEMVGDMQYAFVFGMIASVSDWGGGQRHHTPYNYDIGPKSNGQGHFINMN